MLFTSCRNFVFATRSLLPILIKGSLALPVHRWATGHAPASQSSPARESSDTLQIGIGYYVPALRYLTIGYRARGVQPRALHSARVQPLFNTTRGLAMTVKVEKVTESLSGGNVTCGLERFVDIFRRELWRKVLENECGAFDAAYSRSVPKQVYKSCGNGAHANTGFFGRQRHGRCPSNRLFAKEPQSEGPHMQDPARHGHEDLRLENGEMGGAVSLRGREEGQLIRVFLLCQVIVQPALCCTKRQPVQCG
jgi:hypothetical protein